MKKLLQLKTMLLLCALIVGSGSAWAETVTYTVASTSSVNVSGTAPTGSSATFSNTYSTKEQMTKGNSQTLTLSNYNGYQITGLTLSMKSNGSSGSGKLRYSTDGGTSWTYLVGSAQSGVAFNNAAWHGSYTTTYTNVTKSPLNIICGTSNIVIKIEATANSLYCQSYTVTYEAAKTLDHITLSGTYPTSFTEQDEFSHEGMTVTANYEDSSSKDVTSSATFTGYDMDEIGKQTVTVSYTEGNTTKTATYDITINAGEKYTVAFDPEAGTCGTASLTESAYKGGVTLPSATIGLDGWVFAGWATASQASTTTRPTLYKSGSTYYPTDNTTLHAVYTLDGVNYEKYQRATTLDQITSASQIAIVNASKILDNNLGGVSAPEETDGFIDEPSSGRIWTLSGNNTDGFTLTNGGETLGSSTETFSSSTSYVVSLSSNNNKWLFVESTIGTNNFVVRNKELNSDSKVGSIDYNSGWKIYFLSSGGYAGNSYVASKIYVPVSTVFNSTPTQAIITPDVSFNSTDAKTLYLDGTTTYTNAASVTGVDKPITYSSSDVSVATVNASGVVTAVGIGTATITASVAAELGVNKAASDTYEITVKNTTTIAGLKALYDAAQSPAKAFAADLTDAVVTYVYGNHAYIQDATGAIYASCGSSLTAAGKKINGAVSGTITAPNTIDEIQTIDISAATVTEDGVIPAAAVKTLAEIKAGDYDGKLVTVNGATVKTGMNDATSGGVITDDDNVTTFNIIAPNRLTLNATEEGNFTAFVSIYGGSTYRLNIYEASQFVKTRNVETAQPLAFAEDAVELDEVTPAFAAFTGQAVSGAIGEVSYAMTGDAIGSVNASTGVVTLNGACGTATITATAAAMEVTVADVTTPYTETAKSYTVTVNPRYMVTFSVNGVETVLRQATSGAAIAVPTPAACGDYTFVGWSTSTVAPTDDEPLTMTDLGANVTPEDNDDKYYAVFAQEGISGSGGSYTLDYANESDIYNKDLAYATETNLTASDGGKWVIHAYSQKNNTYGLQINTNRSASIKVPTCPSNITSIEVTCKSGAVNGVGFSSTASGSSVISVSDGTSQTLNLTGKKMTDGYIIPVNGNAIVTYIVVNYGPIITYSDYRTSLPTVEVTITDALYATFCYARGLNVAGTGVTAYTASANGEGEAVTLTKISDNIIPANTGVILFAESAGTYVINVSDTDKDAIDGNELVGVTTRTQIPESAAGKYNYILSKKGEEIGFYRASGAYLLPNRAYLSTSTKGDAAAREFMAIMFDEGETSLREVRGLKAEVRGEFFNLNGQRVATPVKGNIYIVNGKKVMFK